MGDQMIRNEDWINFVATFFNVDPLWVKHIVRNWDWRNNQPGCECLMYIDADGLTQEHKCEEYKQLAVHTRLEDTNDSDIFDDHSEYY
jgi:hypothetical protein